MLISMWLNKIFDQYAGFEEIRTDMISYYNANHDSNESYPFFRGQFSKLNLPEEINDVMSCVFDIINLILKKIDVYELHGTGAEKIESQDILSSFTLLTFCSVLIKNEIQNQDLAGKLDALIIDIVFKQEVKKAYKETSETRNFFRQFYIHVYGPIILSLIISGVEYDEKLIEKSLLSYTINKKMFNYESVESVLMDIIDFEASLNNICSQPINLFNKLI